ncbi:MAG: CRISPR system precrRNA processing endoribonuclease RAMP protein Cas6 [Bryobacteraceae bacterium]
MQGAYNVSLRFRLYPLRFGFRAREPLYFPPGKSANILRGAWGAILRRMACVPQCAGARVCEVRESCAYARMFEPSAIAPGPSGLTDWPRPFVFRANHLDGRTIEPGACFHFDLNVFDLQRPEIAYLMLTFRELAREGLGPGRRRAELAEVSQLDADGVAFALGEPPTPMALTLSPVGRRVERVRVRFVTPTELKSGQKIAERPDFAVLAGRIRDRLSTLREIYDDGPLPIDFRAFGQRASQVRMTRCDIRRVEVERRSSRTGEVHSIGGFVGEAEYEGELAEFVPYLRAAKWVGAGRQTVWGKGQIEIS